MNILFVSDTYYPHLNGVYYFVCRVAPLLQDRGHRVAVIAPAEHNRFTRQSVDAIDVYGMPSVPVVVYPKVRVAVRLHLHARIRQLIRSFRPDVIHIQDHFVLSRAIIAVAGDMSIPVVATNHFMPENLSAFLPYKKWRAIAERQMWGLFSKVYNRVSLVTTPTETAANLIRPKLRVDVRAVSSGIDLRQFNPGGVDGDIRQRYGIPSGPILLFVGRLDPEKNLGQILQAVRLAVSLAHFTLVIAGRGVKSGPLKSMAQQLKIADRVVFTGFVPEADLPGLYRTSSCFIIASEAELLSLATLQALATGLPIIAVRAGALHELVLDKRNGYLFDPGDIEEMSRCIVKMVTNEDLRGRMGTVSLTIAPSHDLNRTADVFESIYEEQSSHRKALRDPAMAGTK